MNPQFPHQDDEYAQQQAEVQRQMQQIMSSPNPVQVAPTNSGSDGSWKIIAVSFLMSLLLPPIGVVLSIICIYKGFISKKNNTLGFSGVGSLIVGICMSLVLALLVFGSGGDNKIATINKIESETVSLEDKLLTLGIPSTYSVIDQSDLSITWKPDNADSAAFISADIGEVQVSDEDIVAYEDQKNEVHDAIWSYASENYMSDCNVPELETAEKVDYEGVRVAIKLTYSCSVVLESGDEIVFVGEYISMIIDGRVVDIIYFIEEENWIELRDELNGAIQNMRLVKNDKT